MEGKDANSNPSSHEKIRTASPEVLKTESSKAITRTRGSEILDPLEMEKYIKLLNFKNKENEQLLKIALKILKYRSTKNDLTSLELEALQNATRYMEFFQTLNSRPINVQLNLHQRCCRAMDYLYLPKGSVVFHKGAASDKLYIILTGSVNIFAAKSQDQIKKEYEWRQSMTRKVTGTASPGQGRNVRRAGISVGHSVSVGYSAEELKKIVESRAIPHQKEYNVKRARNDVFKPKDQSDSSISERSESIAQIHSQSSGEEEDSDEVESSADLMKNLFGGIEVDTIQNSDKLFTNGVFHLIYETNLEAGLLFGELGLLKNKPRERTIICKEDCEFATIAKVDFLEIMNMVKEKKRREKILFTEQCLFPGFVHNVNARYSEVMKKQIVNRGQTIYQDKEKADKIYLIREGEVTLYERKGVTENETEKHLNRYHEFSQLIRKTTTESNKLIPVAILCAAQYFGEEDLLDNQPRTLTAICTSSKAKLYTIKMSDLRKCFDELPATKGVMFKKLRLKLKQRADYKKRNLAYGVQKIIEMQSIEKGSRFYAIRQDVKEILSDENKKFISIRLAEQDAEKKARKNFKKNNSRDEPQQIPSPDASIRKKPDASPVMSRRASASEQNEQHEPVIEYQNDPNAENPKMDYKHFGKKDEDLRGLLLRGVRSEVALSRKKLNTDEVTKMTDIVASNSKTVEYLCKISLPISDLFPMLKEFTTKENEKKQRMRARVKEIERLREEGLLPKITTNESVNIHMQKKRLQRSESVSRAHSQNNRSIERISMAHTSFINSGRGVNSFHKISENVSGIEEAQDLRYPKESFLSGNKMLFRGNSVADSGFSSIETNQDIRYFSTIEMQNERKDLPTKVNFGLNLKSIDAQDRVSGDNTVLFSLDRAATDMEKPPESSRAVLEYREMQKKKNNATFVVKYKHLQENEDVKRLRLQKSGSSRYL